MNDKKNDFKELGRAYHLVIALGLNMVVCVGLSTYIGMFLDEKFSCKPAFTMAGVGLGILAGLWSVFKLLRRFIERK